MDFNSLDAQREACEAYIQRQQGWVLVPSRYDDGGYTGANTDRPAFQRLLADVEAKKIDIVVVYKVDRLSRSLLDFAKLVERFDKAGAAFVSVTQNFSTADPMGKLTLNILMSFAEFERDMIASRTRDKVRAARKKGKWTGGPVPLGYRLEKGRLVVEPHEAMQVRDIFQLYLEHRSFVRLLDLLAERGWTTKFHALREGRERIGRSWTKDALLRVLKNPLYIGQVRTEDDVVPGEHEAIVDPEVFAQVQEKLGSERTTVIRRASEFYLLRGLLHCGECGQAMSPATSHRGHHTYRYYRCGTLSKKGHACATRPMPAGALEDVVVSHVRERVRNGELLHEAAGELQRLLDREREGLTAERSRLPQEIAALSAEINRVMDVLVGAGPGVRKQLEGRLAESMRVQQAKQQRLSEVEQRLHRLTELAAAASQFLERLARLDRIWELLTERNKERMMATIVESIVVDQQANRVRIEFAKGIPLAELEAPDAPEPSGASQPEQEVA
jgi:DNA invertase Pin-like site-specific DNA recombinase